LTRKRIVGLDEAKRALANWNWTSVHTALRTSRAGHQRGKTTQGATAMDQAELNIKNMRITSPIDGIVVIHGNRDSTGGFFFGGMTLPIITWEIGESRSSIAEVIDLASWNFRTGREIDRMNMKTGQTVESARCLLEKIHGQSANDRRGDVAHVLDDNAKHKFDVMVALTV